MRTSSLIHACACITTFLSVVRAFNVTVGTPTQCDELSVSWIGGQAPFEILMIPLYSPIYNILVPASAFSNGQGSYSIPQLPMVEGQEFVLSMSDATGFNSGGMTTLLTVGAPVANNICDTQSVLDFFFDLDVELKQCGGFTFTGYDSAVQPVTIGVVIPGEGYIVLRPPIGLSYTWVADVKAGTSLLFFMTDSQGRQGGVSNLVEVAPSGNTSESCLVINSPSSTMSAPSPSQMSSKSTSPSSTISTVGIIVGAVVIGVVLLVLLTILGICRKRKMYHSSDITYSLQCQSCQLQCKDRGHRCKVDDQVEQNVSSQLQADRRPGSILLSAFSKAHPKDPRENAGDRSFMISARTCYTLHGMLVMIHAFLMITYIYHWEHRATLPFTPTNNDFWSVVLSASLQAFYTIYTAVLIFLTQRLAISRTLVRRLKLTSIHDISGAWTGLGSALSSVWQQIDIPASWWMTSAVAAYLTCISVLHVTSSTLLQFQTFNTTMSTSVPTALGWQDILDSSDVNWGAITASLPILNQLPGLVSAGISNATVYDIPKTSSIVGNATVNATTITSQCGLLSNVTFFVNTSIASTDGGELHFIATPPWSDQIQMLQSPRSYDMMVQPGGIFLMVSTLLDVDASVQKEVSVPMTWEYTNPALLSTSIPYTVDVNFVQCSFSAIPSQVVVDMQTNSLQNPISMLQPSTQWATIQVNQLIPDYPAYAWQLELYQAFTTSPDSGLDFIGATGNTSRLSFMDEYIMELVGLDLTAQYSQFNNWVVPNSTYILTLDKLETAIAHAAAQLIWLAGQVGASKGGLDFGNGTADTIQEIIALRLNVNLLPLIFAASASVIMLGLALHMTGAFHASHDNQAIIPNTGVLQLLWLGHHSTTVQESLEDVEHPTDAKLRHAGMIDVCFAKAVSDEEDQLRSSTDSLSRNSTSSLSRNSTDSQVDHDDRT